MGVLAEGAAVIAVAAAAAVAAVVVPHSASPTWMGGNSRKGTSLQILPCDLAGLFTFLSGQPVVNWLRASRG